MAKSFSSIRAGIVAMAIGALSPVMVLAEGPGLPPPGAHGGCERDFGPPPGFGTPPGRPRMGPEDEGRPPPYLMHLMLSDEQQDKVFSILHEAAPQLREQSKAIRKARDALRALGQSADFAAADAARLAQTAGTAEGQLALLHTRIDHDIYAILTADQRSQLTSAQKNGPHRFDDMPPR